MYLGSAFVDNPYPYTVPFPGFLELETGVPLLQENGKPILLDNPGSVPINYRVGGLVVAERPIWSVDGQTLPRNPDAYDINYDKGNVAYEVNSDGSQTRVSAPYLITGGDLTLQWATANRRLINFIMQFFNPVYPTGAVRKLTFGAIQPPLFVEVYFDTPQRSMSKDFVNKRVGEGGVYHDLKATLRMRKPYFKSVATVPSVQSGMTAAQIAALFGGQAGNGIDYIPVWTGGYWNFSLTGAVNQVVNFQNLGTAPWSPKILLVGPFSAINIKIPVDVDGTGAGLLFTWTGNALVAGSTILVDTFARRVWLTVSGVTTEVYTFTLTTISDGAPYPFWPPFGVGANSLTINATSPSGAAAIDLSNSGAENFPYW